MTKKEKWYSVPTLITLLTTNWPFVVSTILAFIVSFWSFAVDIFSRNDVQAGLIVFFVSLWTLIGIIIIKNLNKPRPVKIVHDCAYSLAITSVALSIFKFPNNHISHQNKSGIALLLGIQNLSNSPLKVRVKNINLVLSGRAIVGAPNDVNLYIPMGTLKSIRSGLVEYIPTQRELNGYFSCEVDYGPWDKEYQRTYTCRSDIFANIVNSNDDSYEITTSTESIQDDDREFR
ncbi:MAG: hypothetical protein J0L77_04340 [Alphaproteobacteria bacterium]|nr:hypothetical protein [Alphaproteobacteria bacterium]